MTMTRYDKSTLESFFKEIMIWDTCGYTIFGAKPMWMGTYRKPFCTASWNDFLTSISPPNLRKYFGWKALQKYQSFFEGSDYLFWSEESPFWPFTVVTLFIHKPSFHETINSYIDDFQKVLGTNQISSDQFLLEATKRPFLKDILLSHDALMGIFFGFGRNNAWLFVERRIGNETPLQFIWDADIYEFYDNRPNDYWWWLGTFPKETKLYDLLDYPTFLADPDSQETKDLKVKLLATRKEILDYYEGKDFFEATLALLMDDPQKK